MNLDRSNNQPRDGLSGFLDRLTGPGATNTELLLQLVPSLVAMVAASLYALALSAQWTAVQLGLIALLALDLVGGVLTKPPPPQSAGITALSRVGSDCIPDLSS
jgi:hypothetical protein